MGHVSRNTGRSAVQAVAYITRTRLVEERRGITADYRSKSEKVFWETLAPRGSGIGKGDALIWNRLENFEEAYGDQRYKTLQTRQDYKDTARTAHTYVFALPKELSQEHNIELLRTIIQKRFISRGLVATYGIHWEEGNPHVHILVSHRAVEGNIKKGGTFSYLKVAREICTRSGLRETRKVFADETNVLFESLGMSERIDHRSYADRGIDLIPTFHKGWKAHQLEREGKPSRIALQNEEIIAQNKERILQKPQIILKELTSKQATFSEMDVIGLVQKRLKDESSCLAEYVIAAVLKQAVEVGKGLDESRRYTSPEYFEKEAQVLASFKDYQQQKASFPLEVGKVDALLARLEETQKQEGVHLNEGQKAAIKTLCGDARLSVLIGRAGTGKTTALKHVVDLHKQSGYSVWGMAPSAVAASQLEADTGSPSNTIAHYSHYWKKYHVAAEGLKNATTDLQREEGQNTMAKLASYLPDANSLILIDEAGMVGIGSWKDGIPGGWEALTKTLDLTGSKLIIVGDDHQFKPIEAGDVFRKIVEEIRKSGSLCELDAIMRQHTPWMREASRHLAELNTGTALEMYERQGHLEAYTSPIEVYEAIARQYLCNITRAPDSTGIVLAATNEERQNLNREIRGLLKATGLLPQEDVLVQGEDGYAVGDRIIFTQNDRGYLTCYQSPDKSFFVRNNTHAVIESIEPWQIKDEETDEITHTFRIVASVPSSEGNHKSKVEFTVAQYPHFKPAYAVTGYSTQGLTVDWTLAKLSRFMDAYGLYVCLTRHRGDISLYYSTRDFSGFGALVRSLGRVSYKDLVADYSIEEEKKEYWQNVQDYKEVGRELLGIRTLARTAGKPAQEALWQEYRQIEAERRQLARIILDDRQGHKDYLRQAGLTFEILEIASGLKQRPLSRIEAQGQLTVEQYVSAALEARQLWQNIRRTHPGLRAKTHPDWGRFEEVRDQRGVLANLIHQNPILHCPFLKGAAGQLDQPPPRQTPGQTPQNISYSLRTIQVQAEAHQSRMLQQELLRNPLDFDRQSQLQILLSYTEARDSAGAIWQEVRPKLKEFEGTLLKDAFSKAIAEYAEVRMARDVLALQIMDQQKAFEELATQVGMKLDFDKLREQSVQATRDQLFKAYQPNNEESARLKAAFGLSELMKGESTQPRKVTVSQIYQNGLQPKNVACDALEYQKLNVFENLASESDRALFILLDAYDALCRKANGIYAQCANETKDTQDWRPWHSVHYPAYKVACEERNDLALEVFDQRDHTEVLSLAESMGIRFRDVELQEIFARCQQATRTRHIKAYLKAENADDKGQAAMTLCQMIAFERTQGTDKASVTAQQAYHSGITFQKLQETAFAYGRTCVLKKLSGEAEIRMFHNLEAYEKHARLAKGIYKACIEESQAQTTLEKAVKPWETDSFKGYIAEVKVQDGYACELVKGQDMACLTRLAKDMGISVRGIDVAAHRHSLRQTLELYIDGDRSTVPMAAQELLHWLAFDRDGDHRHTFKILREQNLFPRDVYISLGEFHARKRALRQETHQEIRTQARQAPVRLPSSPDPARPGQAGPDAKYETVYREKRQTWQEIEQQLKHRTYDLATDLMGNPKMQGDYLRFGKSGKYTVRVKGDRIGTYMNFATGIGGGLFKMIEDHAGVSGFKDALSWATDWLGGQPLIVERRLIEVPKDKKTSTWMPVVPVPRDVKAPDIINDKYLNYMLRDGARETHRHAYRDAQGNLKGYVVRIEHPDGTKFTPPLAYCKNEKGFKAWKWQAFEKENKTPYGIEKLAHSTHKPILVVEGEKTADAAQKLLPGYHVLCWGGGAGNVGKTNWEPLVDKEVIIWPDNDEGGQKAAQKLQQTLIQLNREAGRAAPIGIVKLPDYLSSKWDLADTLPEGWTVDTIQDMLKEALSLTPKQEPKPLQDNLSLTQSVSFPQVLPAGDPLEEKRESFEKGRFTLNQEWCEKFHFYQIHKRFPKPEELADTFWQGERLTAIEGRLFGEALKEGQAPSIAIISQEARQELLKREGVASKIHDREEITKVGLEKRVHLSSTQIEQVDQHILLYTDKTGKVPSIGHVKDIIAAVEAHTQVLKEGEPYGQPVLLSAKYGHLLEQQEALARLSKAEAPVNESSALLSTKDKKITDLNIKINRILQVEMDAQQRERNRDRGMDL